MRIMNKSVKNFIVKEKQKRQEKQYLRSNTTMLIEIIPAHFLVFENFMCTYSLSLTHSLIALKVSAYTISEELTMKNSR